MTEVVCGNAHLELLTDHDRQEVNDFSRFLQLPKNDRGRTIVDWRWMAYVEGKMGAPPKLWEGDYS